MLNVAAAEKTRAKRARPALSIVPYLAMLRPGVMLNKDGSLMACFSLRGPDIDGIGEREMDAVANLLEHAMKPLDERFTLWWTVRRRRTAQYPEADFGENAIAAFIDRQHRDTFMKGALYENQHFLTMLFTPFSGMAGFFDRISIHLRKEKASIYSAIASSLKEAVFMRNRFHFDSDQIDSAAGQFEDIVSEFSDTLAAISFNRLELSEMMSFLHACVNPWIGNPRKVNMPRSMMIDAYLPEAEITTGRDLMAFEHPLGDHMASALSVKDFPSTSRPGLMDSLLSLNGEITISMVFRFLSQEKAAAYISKRRRHHELTQKSLLRHIKDAVFKMESDPDPGKAALAEEAAEALGDITSKNARYGYFNFTVLGHGRTPEEADETTRLLTAAVNQAGFLSIRERVGLQSAFSGTLPGQWGEIFRWHFVTASNLADMAPVRTLDSGDKINAYLSEQSGSIQPANAVFQTLYNTPYYLNLHNGDLGHFLLIGPSRTGKSVFVNLLIALYQKHNPLVFIFDKNASCRIPVLLQDGNYVDVDDGHVKSNPMLLVEDRRHWPFLVNWLELLLTYRGRALKSDDDKRIQNAIEAVHDMSPELWRLSSVRSQITGALGDELDIWVDNGQLAHLFDNMEDGFSLGDINAMEMGGLILRYPKAALSFMEYAFYRIEQAIGQGRPAFIYVEEGWFMMGNAFFARRLDDWLRTLGKKNAVVGMSTQSFAEIENSDLFSPIVDSIPNRIFLPNDDAFAHRVAYKEKLSLTDEEIGRIASAIPKRHYFMVSPNAKRMLDLPLNKEMLACLRSDVKAQHVFDGHYDNRENNRDWKWRYIKEMSA